MGRMLSVDFDLLWRPSRWILAFAAITLIYGLNIVGFGLRGPGTNQWDVVFSVVNNPFVGMILLPMIFLIVVLDIAWRDIQEWRSSLWVRLSCRGHWWLTKMVVVMTAALTYVSGVFSLGLVIGILVAPFQGGWSARAFRSGSATVPLVAHHMPPEGAVLWSFLLLWGAITAFGALAITFTILWRGPATAGAVMAGLAFAAYGLWITHPSWGLWFPSFQGILSAHAAFDPRVPRYFRVAWSLVLDGGLFAIGFFVGGWRVARMSL